MLSSFFFLGGGGGVAVHITYLKVTNFYRYICLRFLTLLVLNFANPKTFMTVSSRLEFLLVLNFAVWDTIAKKAKISTRKQL